MSVSCRSVYAIDDEYFREGVAVNRAVVRGSPQHLLGADEDLAMKRVGWIAAESLTRRRPAFTLISEVNMRVEATLSEARGQQLDEAARELGVSRSELINEAVAILLTSLHEYSRGFRLALVNRTAGTVVRELVTPVLAQVEWHTHREKLTLAKGEKLAAAISADPEPTTALRKLVSRRRTNR